MFSLSPKRDLFHWQAQKSLACCPPTALIHTDVIAFLALLFQEIGELMLSPRRPRWRTRCQLGQTFACNSFSQTLCMLLL